MPMRKKRKIAMHVRMERQRRRLREWMRMRNVLNGIGTGMTINDIHHKTGLSEKNIRKIMLEHPEEITFVLLAKQTEEKK